MCFPYLFTLMLLDNNVLLPLIFSLLHEKSRSFWTTYRDKKRSSENHQMEAENGFPKKALSHRMIRSTWMESWRGFSRASHGGAQHGYGKPLERREINTKTKAPRAAARRPAYVRARVTWKRFEFRQARSVPAADGEGTGRRRARERRGAAIDAVKETSTWLRIGVQKRALL